MAYVSFNVFIATCRHPKYSLWSAAALALRKNGIAVRLIEKALDYQIGVRGNGIQVSAMAIPGSLICDSLTNALLQPRILELFKTLGLVIDILDNSIDPLQMRAYDGKLSLGRGTLFQRKSQVQQFPTCPNGRILAQSTTEAILRSHLSRLGITVELGDGTRRLHTRCPQGDCKSPKARQKWFFRNETLEVDWVIGADGARGVTRKHLGINFWGETLEKQAFLVADVDMEGLDREYWAVYGSAATGLVMALPMGPAPHFSVVGTGNSEEIQKAVDGGFDALKAYLSKIMKDDSVVLTKPHCGPNVRCADKFNVGRVFIAGDGAHVHSPMGGQGLNSSVQDSVNLAWKLSLVVKNLSPRSLLSTYETERMPPIKEMLKLTTNLHTQSMSDRSLASKDTSQSVNPGFVRDHVFKQLGVNYQWSEIVLDQRLDIKNGDIGGKVYRPYGNDDEPIQAGDRAPDAPNLDTHHRRGRHRANDTLRSPDAFCPYCIGIRAPAKPPPTDTEPPSSASTSKNILDALGKYNKDGHRLVDSYLVLPENTSDASSGRVLGGVNRVLVDTQGHARTAYDVDASQARKTLPSVVIIRPDTYIGAFVHDVQGNYPYMPEHPSIAPQWRNDLKSFFLATKTGRTEPIIATRMPLPQGGVKRRLGRFAGPEKAVLKYVPRFGTLAMAELVQLIAKLGLSLRHA
ncbi:hypothetical protein BS47DRAFT_1400122 [Hydnum rufescens UP504]|uniref:FAD-binding domain-containing protein n=1 Tax=Hydnum rufescens UP504 TaxID=1448309 RepID=A0A9P6AH58_9AGAM|nr:hypothetical protein BS47DRAFT_1400122 [Hydnum rufescens UP504]